MKKILNSIGLKWQWPPTFTNVSYAQEKKCNGGLEQPCSLQRPLLNAMNSKDHTTLVAAVKAAGLVETLQGRRTVYSICSNKWGFW